MSQTLWTSENNPYNSCNFAVYKCWYLSSTVYQCWYLSSVIYQFQFGDITTTFKWNFERCNLSLQRKAMQKCRNILELQCWFLLGTEPSSFVKLRQEKCRFGSPIPSLNFSLSLLLSRYTIAEINKLSCCCRFEKILWLMNIPTACCELSWTQALYHLGPKPLFQHG